MVNKGGRIWSYCGRCLSSVEACSLPRVILLTGSTGEASDERLLGRYFLGFTF